MFSLLSVVYVSQQVHRLWCSSSSSSSLLMYLSIVAVADRLTNNDTAQLMFTDRVVVCAAGQLVQIIGGDASDR
jgi:hypothetical protein